MCVRQHPHCSAHSLRNVRISIYLQWTGVYTSIVQTAGRAYTSVQITALQDFGTEMNLLSGVGLYSEFYSICSTTNWHSHWTQIYCAIHLCRVCEPKMWKKCISWTLQKLYWAMCAYTMQQSLFMCTSMSRLLSNDTGVLTTVQCSNDMWAASKPKTWAMLYANPRFQPSKVVCTKIMLGLKCNQKVFVVHGSSHYGCLW